jgi:tRNA G26 N,N-dimethylase Trm1
LTPKQRENQKKYREKHKEKIKKTLDLAKSEVDAPVSYYVVDRLCDMLNLPVPPVKKVAEALREEGHYAVLTQFNSKGIKSNASATIVKRALQKALSQG